MVKYCSNCGAANTPDARFCARCGHALVAPMPNAGHDPEPAAPAPQMAGAAIAEDSGKTSPGKSSNWPVIAAILGAILILGGVYYWLFIADDVSGGSLSSAAPAEVEAGVASVQRFTITEANIRDRPTTSGSAIIGKLPRGSAISGVLKVSEDGSEWLELSEGKGFVATVNLVETQPPAIVQPLNGRTWVTDSRIDIFAPATDGELLESISEGTKLTLLALVENDFLEVRLADGRIGYVRDGKTVLARLGGKPIAIAFNPQTCDVGPELTAEFARIAARLKAQWEALEAKEFASEQERERAVGQIEGQSTYVRLARSFEGLSLTAIGQHYESQSLYFSDPPAKVIETFRRLGYRIGADGTFAATEIYAGISATRGEGARYGKSELGCGV